MLEDSLYAIYLDTKNLLMLLNKKVRIIENIKESVKDISINGIMEYLRTIPDDAANKEAKSLAVDILTELTVMALPSPKEDLSEKMEQLLSATIMRRSKCEEMLSEVIDRMRKSNDSNCQMVVAFLGSLPEGESLSLAVSLLDTFEKSYASMQNQGYSGDFFEFTAEFGSKILQSLGEQTPSGEDFPGSSGRRK